MSGERPRNTPRTTNLSRKLLELFWRKQNAPAKEIGKTVKTAIQTVYSSKDIRYAQKTIRVSAVIEFSGRKDPWILTLARLMAEQYSCTVYHTNLEKNNRKPNETIGFEGYEELALACKSTFLFCYGSITSILEEEEYMFRCDHPGKALPNKSERAKEIVEEISHQVEYAAQTPVGAGA